MDGMEGFLSRYVSSNNSHMPAYDKQQQKGYLFTSSPSKNDISNGDSCFDKNQLCMDASLNGNIFCHRNNLNECLDHLNRELTSLGFESLFESGSQTYDPVRLANCVNDLLQQFQRSRHIKEELENRIHFLQCDLTRSKEVEHNMSRQLDQKEREIVQIEECKRQLTVANKQLAAKLKSEKEEVKRLQSVLQHRNTQYRHEVKKKERENGKLKDRLNRMLTTKEIGKTGITISSVLQRPDGSRSAWSGSRQNEELFHSVIISHEVKEKQLMIENSGLRKCLSGIQTVLLADNLSSSDDTENSSLNGALEDYLKPGQGDADQDKQSLDSCNLPCEFLEQSLVKSIIERCRHLKKYIQSLEKEKSQVPVTMKSAEKKNSPSRNEQKHAENIDKLMRDIKRYKEIIEQQEQFIQDALSKNSTDTDASFLNESELEEEKEKLEFQKRLFEEQKANFKKERNAFTEATLRLHKERKKFEETRTMFLKDQFLQISPFNTKTEKVAGKLPSTPSQGSVNESSHYSEPLPPLLDQSETPESQKIGRVVTPATVDLYKLLGLKCDKKVMENRPKSADTANITPTGFLSKRNCSPSWASSGTRRCTSAINHTRTPKQQDKTVTEQTPNIQTLLHQHRNRVLDLSDGEEVH